MLDLNSIKNFVKGDVETGEETLKRYSTDASIFEVKPQAVVFPKDAEDVKNLVRFVHKEKHEHPELSLTARSAGTDMTGGPLTESIVVEFSKYFNNITSPPTPLLGKERGERGEVVSSVVVQPGVYYRDFEKETLKHDLILPSYPASKSICALGGMVSNNSGGEKSLLYGQTNRYVRRLRVALSDGNEYEFQKIDALTLQKKKAQGDFEGGIYRKVYQLLEDNFETIQRAKPKVSKNSAGYYLWNVWDRKDFDLTQLFTGSQGTLGIITEIELGLVSKKKYRRLAVVFLPDVKKLSEFSESVLEFKPESLETFDDATLRLALRFLPDIAKKIGGAGLVSLLSLAFQFKKEFLMALRRGLPKFVVLVELTSDDSDELAMRVKDLERKMGENGTSHRIMHSEREGEAYWLMRRESFNLLRERVKDKRATPFIDDIIVPPDTLPRFLPRLYAILKEYHIQPTLAGHAGSGNFHVIPLMDLSKEEERKKIPEVLEKVIDLVIKYGGSITAEHNDGLIRSPYLQKMYGREMVQLFQKIKEIFDPENIFNPGKKVGASLEYAMSHIKTTP